jgi:hypothetical protein
MLLTLSLSAHDYIGHAFGPDSWEEWDELRRLDESLSEFLSHLDRKIGTDAYSVVLSADHGSASLPETDPRRRSGCDTLGMPKHDRWNRPCTGGGRVQTTVVATRLEAAAKAAVGPGHWVHAVVEPYVWLTPEGRQLDATKRHALTGAFRASLVAQGSFADVVDVRAVEETCPPEADETVPALVCRSVLPEVSGDFYLVVKPGHAFDADYTPGYGANHGSPYIYDRSVPLFVRGPGVKAGNMIDPPISYRVFEHTISDLLGLKPLPGTQQLPRLVGP